MKFIKYNRHNGRILACGSQPGSVPLLGLDNEAFIIVQNIPDVKGFYVDLANKTLLPMPILPVTIDRAEIVADGVDIATIQVPTEDKYGNDMTVRLFFDGQYSVIGDGVLEFSTIVEGTHSLRFDAINYKPITVEIVANAPETS